MNMLKLTAAAIAVVCMSGAASAATFEFDLDADAFFDSSGYEGSFDQVYGGNADAVAAGTNGGNSDMGITVTASATNGTASADPFMDSDGNRDITNINNLAGLGVCSNGFITSGANAGISQCSTGPGSNKGDDNLVSPEMLTLMFSGAGSSYNLSGLLIRDANHNLITDTTAIVINSGTYGATLGVVDLTGLASNSVFTFTSTGENEQIYLSVLSVQPVPLPAAGFLLLAGLGGLAAMKRRKAA